MSRSLSFALVTSLLLAITLGSALGLWHLSGVSGDLVRSSAVESAAQMAETLDELNHRLGAVFSARTYGQLTRIMADLPRLRRPDWVPVSWPPDGFPPHERRPATPSDRAGRFAALSLLVLAMVIWLLTAMLFARHGFYYYPGPPGGH